MSRTNYGFDYWHHHIQDQMELAFALKTGTFPLFIPGYFHGQTAFVLSEGQLLHPFFHVIRHLPGYWQGRAADWSMLLHLLGLAGAHLALFSFLRRLNMSVMISFFLSTTAVYNLRMVFLSWFGSPMEAWSGHILLCSAIGCYYLKPTAVKGPLLIIGAAFWLITCGHPVWTYYGLITAALFTILLPFYAPAMRFENSAASFQTRLRFWGKITLFCALALLLSGGYIIPYYIDFVSTNAGIVDQPYAWATSQPEPFGECLNNFFLPLRTGYAMFAGTPLFLAVLLIPMMALFRTKTPGTIWAILGIILFVFLYMQGSATPVHRLVWEYLPLHHMIRGPARLAFTLPLLFMLVLAWIFQTDGRVSAGIAGVTKGATAPAVLGITALALLALFVLSAPESITTDLAPHARLNLSRLPAWPEPLIFVTSVLSLLALVIYGMAACPWKQVSMIFLCAVTLVHLGLIFKFAPPYYSPLAARKQSQTLDEMMAHKRNTMNIHMDHYYLNPGRGHQAVTEQLRNYFVEPHLGKIYRNHITVGNLTDAYRILNQRRQPDEVVLETIVGLDLPEQARAPLSDIPDRVVLEYSSYNRFVFSATTGQPAFFVFAYPHTGHWRAWVNGHPGPTFRANGVSHAVRIPAGTSRVEFRYWSRAAALGMGVSCATLALIGCWLAFFRIRKPYGYLIVAAAIVLAGGVFALWRGSLYSGKNLGTEYTWESPPPGTVPNIAYGKHTTMSSYKKGDLWFPDLYNSRHAVDGDSVSALTSSSHTDLEENPWWQVDLQSPVEVGSIIIYLTPPYDFLPFNGRPLSVSFSINGEGWQSALIGGNGQVVRIDFQEPVKMRYLKIQAAGRCVLSLMEVEVYPAPVSVHPP
ncbi:MAG: discoidin domain-containing protein [Thermodesulfobacteriota bacterium]